jgi:hypothetical protein
VQANLGAVCASADASTAQTQAASGDVAFRVRTAA